ncbi:hypothetical protein MGYG_02487 [Nannizzia gypsea CBS 118893]|uniref:Tse2 ADP-ribosyltransferase toxin domain-containing protein n=1 Tax=Arthroderma gypseum (strain ATCC MYA-4604 / CBS 118893) TaxID=535722 RepID=E4UMW2_ARTGP|nr:hypothetical protein MGYG_02487 [Nannizzia gypsea CBS 118893]EFQ99476.1 hypothetical protein MGYG_02487 [Nannizzia gypsea CBS 118893]
MAYKYIFTQPRFMKFYSVIPKGLFHINNGRVVGLRAYPGPRRPPGLFDLLTYWGYAPNGASMRSNTLKVRQTVDSLRGSSVCIYTLDAGIRIPDDLILVHEIKDHYSRQGQGDHDNLDAKITSFLQRSGRCLSKAEWQREYPEATETE